MYEKDSRTTIVERFGYRAYEYRKNNADTNAGNGNKNYCTKSKSVLKIIKLVLRLVSNLFYILSSL